MFDQTLSLPRPGITQGIYPEQKIAKQDGLENFFSHTERFKKAHWNSRTRCLQKFVNEVNKWSVKYSDLNESGLNQIIDQIKQMPIKNFRDHFTTAKTFALIRELSDRMLGQRHYDVQISAGWVMLNGLLIEMKTGEGKTLTATLPACTAALAGIPVHIISVNDYLVARDAENMAPLYNALGLTVGMITESMNFDQRKAAYKCDIVYCTGKQLVFDYLKDRLTIGKTHHRKDQLRKMQFQQLYSAQPASDRLLLNGLCFAIVDEADSVLIDEARTPLILSKPGQKDNETSLYQQALELAATLKIRQHFVIDSAHRQLSLTSRGQTQLASAAENLSGLWQGQRRRSELVTQALSALHLFKRNQHYLVRDGVIEIIDEHTGRTLPDRKWEQGLHQMIECKESCELSKPNETLARITNQRFYRRYLHLTGMTGTAKEVSHELWENYRLGIIPVPAHKPDKKETLAPQLFSDSKKKWRAVLQNVVYQNDHNRPVLIATRSVACSESISHLLTQEGLSHRLLNAAQDKDEAAIIAQAGKAGRITVATNMAGRGTDIKLDELARKSGGLHVVLCEANLERRLDRQVTGRCGRQGDPGSSVAIFSLDDEIYQQYLPALLRPLLAKKTSLSPLFIKVITPLAQRFAEKRNRNLRQALLKEDQRLGTLLAFSGSPE